MFLVIRNINSYKYMCEIKVNVARWRSASSLGQPAIRQGGMASSCVRAVSGWI